MTLYITDIIRLAYAYDYNPTSENQRAPEPLWPALFMCRAAWALERRLIITRSASSSVQAIIAGALNQVAAGVFGYHGHVGTLTQLFEIAGMRGTEQERAAFWAFFCGMYRYHTTY